MTEHEKGYFLPEVPAGISQLEIMAFTLDLCAGGIRFNTIFFTEQEKEHGTVQVLLISDFRQQEYTLSDPCHIFPEYFYILHPNNYPW